MAQTDDFIKRMVKMNGSVDFKRTHCVEHTKVGVK
jgi:hypothetical protein